MPLITIGDSTSLIIKIPSKGDTNWATDLKVEAWQKITAHDHTGGGKGAQIKGAAIADYAITEAKIASSAITTTKLDSTLQQKMTDVSNNTASIAVNLGLIQSNASNITLNQSAISDLQLKVGDLEEHVTVIASSADASAYQNTQGDTVIVTSSSPITLPALDCTRLIIRGTAAVTITGNVTGCVVQTVNGEDVDFKGSVIASVINIGGIMYMQANQITTNYIDECQINAQELQINPLGSGSTIITNSDVKVNIFNIVNTSITIDPSTFMRGANIQTIGGSITLGTFSTALVPITNVEWTINNAVFKADLIFEGIPGTSYTMTGGGLATDIRTSTTVINTSSVYSNSNNRVTVPLDGVYEVQVMKAVNSAQVNQAATLRILIEHSGGFFGDIGNSCHMPAISQTPAITFANASMNVTLNAGDFIEGSAMYWGPTGTSDQSREKLIIRYKGTL